MGIALAIAACLCNSLAYVGLLYLWRSDLPRDHPSTIKRRLVSTALASCVAWLPVYFWARTHQSATPVLWLLGLRWRGLSRAVGNALYLTATLFAGPLLYSVYCLDLDELFPPLQHEDGAQLGQRGAGATAGRRGSDGEADAAGEASAARAAPPLPPGLRQREGLAPGSQQPGEDAERRDARGQQNVDERTGAWTAHGKGGGAGGGGGGWGSRVVAAAALACRDLRLIRNLVAAPLCEEWVFRACMAPLLVMEGMRPSHAVWLTPLFFGAAHLHHAAELVRHQGVRPARAAAMVAFQMSYTTVFGWLACYLFLRTGHLAAPLAAHAACNWAGLPPLAAMARHPRSTQLLGATAAGLLVFALLLPRMTRPGLYGQDWYGW